MARESSFSAEVVETLRVTDRRLRGSDRGDQPYRYAVCRATLSAIMPVDSFYVAFYRDESTLVIPYIYDHEQFLPPDVSRFGPRGLSHWIRVSRKPYRWADDDGALLNKSLPFGDTSTRSADALLVPLLNSVDGSAAGLLSVQSMSPSCYTDEHLKAAQWVAQALMRTMATDQLDADDSDLYEIYPELDSGRIRNEQDLISQVNLRMDQLRAAISALSDAAVDAGQDALASSADSVRNLCERLQVELTSLVHEEHVSPALESHLTARELQIATLITEENLSNAQLAERLRISQKTVKTHVGHILAKLGVAQRSAIAWTLQSS